MATTKAKSHAEPRALEDDQCQVCGSYCFCSPGPWPWKTLFVRGVPIRACGTCFDRYEKSDDAPKEYRLQRLYTRQAKAESELARVEAALEAEDDL